MEIIVIGGGPAGARSAALLAGQGHGVTLIDARAPWEKPCGGGLTAKALDLDPTLGMETPHCRVEELSIQFGTGTPVRVCPTRLPAVVSRRELGQYLLNAAECAGVRVVRDQVRGIDRTSHLWRVTTRDGSFESEFIVGADGTTSLVRRNLGVPFSSRELHVTLGYFIPSTESAEMKIYFAPNLEGYIWSFPRPDHVSYGLISSPEPGWASRYKRLLGDYVRADLGPNALKNATFYSAPVPCLNAESWKTNTISGKGWALVGDAAGLVDPITGEGIYYALRSADLLAERFPDSNEYQTAVNQECVSELARASEIYGRFYRGGFMGRPFTERMVQVARRSPAIRTVLADLVAGGQPYADLKARLLRSLPKVSFELVRSLIYG